MSQCKPPTLHSLLPPAFARAVKMASGEARSVPSSAPILQSQLMSRWIPAFSMLLVSLISYVDRSTLALLAPTILKETHLTGEQYGFIISAFSIAYMLSNPIWGWILDRVGLRRGMSAAVAWWTVASVAHAFAGGFWSFARGARGARFRRRRDLSRGLARGRADPRPRASRTRPRRRV